MGGCEWIENNFYVMVCVWSNATTITYSLGTSRNYEPLWFVIQLAIGAAFHVRGGITFWKTMNVCAVCTALVILVYIFAAMTSRTDQFYGSPFDGKPEYTFQGGAGAFFRSLHAPTWFYIGCETSMIAVSKINNGTDVVPKALRMTFIALAAISFWMLFCVKATQTEDWSSLVESNYPLSYGFAKNLHWDYRLAALLTIPPNMSSILGFLYASELTTHSMATSGLMPIFLRKTVGVNQVPLNALFSCIALQFVLLMYFWAESNVSTLSNSTTTASGATSSCTSSPNNTFNLRLAVFSTPTKPEAPPATTTSPPVVVETSTKEDELLSMPINPPISAKKAGDSSPMVPLSKAKSIQMLTRSFRHSVVEDDHEAEPDRHDDAVLRSVDHGDEVDDEERRDVYVLDDEKHSDADEGHRSRGSSRRSSGRGGSDLPDTASAKGLLQKASSWMTLPSWLSSSLLGAPAATAQGNASRVVPMTSTSLDFHPQHQSPPTATLQSPFPMPARIDTSAAPYGDHHRHRQGQEMV
eukprot:gene2216-1619_t